MAPKKTESSDESEETVTLPKSQLEDLLSRIEKLEARPRVDDVEISTDIPQAAGLKPGQYVNIAPANAAPELRKVRWTRASIEREYPAVPLNPLISVTVAPHGIPWALSAGEPVNVPSIVRDFHDAEVYRQRHQFDRYKPESPMEIIESIQRSKENPGTPVWGRLHIVGHGLAMGGEPADPAPLPPSETKA